jgi:hypothetical protein
MKYMLMMHAPRGTGDWGADNWAPADRMRMISFMKELTGELKASGALVGAEGLMAPSQAVQVRAGKDGSPTTDGVFPESKEFLAGYWIVDVDTPQQAYAIAARASSCPGPGGTPLNFPVEVRQVGSAPPDDLP